MSEINVIPIGSGSTGNSIYIEIDDLAFLVDMGIGYRKVNEALLNNKRSMDDIKAIFVTHGHNDHIKAATAICNHTDCKVYTNKTVMYGIRDVNAERVELKVNKVTEILPGFKVDMFAVPHDFVQTCAYTFTYKNKKVSYLTDCGETDNRILSKLYDSDLVIIESNHDIEMLKHGPYPKFLQERIMSEYGHLSNEQCAKIIHTLYKKGTKNFILAHLSLNNNTTKLAYEESNNIINDKDVFIHVCEKESDVLLSF